MGLTLGAAFDVGGGGAVWGRFDAIKGAISPSVAAKSWNMPSNPFGFVTPGLFVVLRTILPSARLTLATNE